MVKVCSAILVRPGRSVFDTVCGQEVAGQLLHAVTSLLHFSFETKTWNLYVLPLPALMDIGVTVRVTVATLMLFSAARQRIPLFPSLVFAEIHF